MSRRNATGFASIPGSVTLLPTITGTTGAAEDEPSPQELAAIEAEGPLIAAELAVVEAEIAMLGAPYGPSELDWRRLRRARDRVLREAAALASRSVPSADRQAA